MIIISGPSAVGKSTLITRLLREFPLEFVVPSTTRQIRIGEEIADRDYKFLSRSDFQAGIVAQRFEDWDYALGNYYGFERSSAFGGGRPAIAHALAKMAVRIRSRHPSIVLIFLRPADPEAHVARLTKRFKDLDARTARLQHWHDEIVQEALFDHVITISDTEDALTDEHRALWKSLGLHSNDRSSA